MNRRVMKDHRLDYIAVAPAYLRLLERVQVRDRLLYLKLASLFTLGTIATWIGPVLIWAIIRGVRRSMGHVDDPSFALTTMLIGIVVIPLLFVLERRTRGDFFADELRAQNPGGYDRPSSY